MSLILPSGPRWAYCTDNLPATPSPSVIGIAVTPGYSNTDGAEIALLPALAHDVELLRVGFCGFSMSGGNTSTLVDILVDTAGGSSYTVLIEHLLAGFTGVPSNTGGSNVSGVARWYDLPLWLPAGASLAARARTNYAGPLTTGAVFVQAYGGNAVPASWWCGQKVITLGVDETVSRGTMVTPGASPSWGAWTDIGTALPVDCGALAFGVQGIATAVQPTSTDYWRFGVGGAQLGPTILKTSSMGEASWTMATGPVFASVAAGAQIQARGLMSGTVSAVDCAVYAVS